MQGDNEMSQAATQSMATRSLGEIAASLPGATVESLEEAARHKGLALAPIQAELASLSHG